MEYRAFGSDYIIRLDPGEEILETLTAFCKKEDIKLGVVYGLGATDLVTVSVYDLKEQVFSTKTFEEPMEISDLTGNINTMDGETYLHLHITLCDRALAAHGGHLKACRISATGELHVHKIEGCVDRKKDPVTGLNIFDFN